jgi:thiol-disulfide isomerase/thioredoxin
MDRLPALTLVALLLALSSACRERPKPRETVERFNAVQADPQPTAKAEGFCDVMATGARARPFHYPELAAPAPPATSRPRWVNVWATWCKPCVEELPLLLRWQEQLAKDGAPFDLVLLSLDEDDDSIQRFRKQHPGVPPSQRIKDLARAERWVVTLGLEKASAIPIHVLVDARGRIRCARAGGVGRDHFSTVQAILAGGGD